MDAIEFEDMLREVSANIHNTNYLMDELTLGYFEVADKNDANRKQRLFNDFNRYRAFATMVYDQLIEIQQKVDMLKSGFEDIKKGGHLNEACNQ